ncbi:MAG TPA: hypothetical protein VNO34_04610, partial [Actinomycetota bacterium]|nr:hypothetical protein [Actinomycetota bacterium]
MERGERDRLIGELHSAGARLGAAQRAFLAAVGALAGEGIPWRDQGVRDLPHFLSVRFGMSLWRAHR